MKIDGRILFYNTQSGYGSLMLKSGEKSAFSSAVWNDFEHIPETGLLIKCLVEDGIITSIISLNSNTSLTPSNTIKTFQNDTKTDAKSIPQPEEQERPTYSVSETLEMYFKPIENAIGEPPKIVNTQAQLDYLLSKRFLLTAYNNLKGIDSTIYEHKEIKDSSIILTKLEKAYYSITEKIDIPHIAFEMIFLNPQPEYIQYVKYKESSLDRIHMLGTIIDSIYVEIQKKESDLEKTSIDKIKIELENKLKKLRGSYADNIHEKATLKEELSSMRDIKAIYTENYFHSFSRELSILKVEYKKIIVKILNYKSYELDRLMWKYASKSRLVQGYFNNAGIKGDYSTITYLLYYIKSLDKEKIKEEEQKDLFKLLSYLKK